MTYLEMGGYLFTIPLTLIAVGMLAATGRTVQLLIDGDQVAAHRPMDLVLHLGVFAFILGVLGQTLGLFEAMTFIEAAPNIAPAVLAGGLKVSFVTTVYGLIILTVSFLAWMILRAWSRRPNQ
jgi:MotA/TolQ/ExbB proton channel family protein